MQGRVAASPGALMLGKRRARECLSQPIEDIVRDGSGRVLIVRFGIVVMFVAEMTRREES